MSNIDKWGGKKNIEDFIEVLLLVKEVVWRYIVLIRIGSIGGSVWG